MSAVGYLSVLSYSPPAVGAGARAVPGGGLSAGRTRPADSGVSLASRIAPQFLIQPFAVVPLVFCTRPTAMKGAAGDVAPLLSTKKSSALMSGLPLS